MKNVCLGFVIFLFIGISPYAYSQACHKHNEDFNDGFSWTKDNINLWRLQTDAKNNLGFYLYRSDTGNLANPLFFNLANKSIKSSWYSIHNVHFAGRGGAAVQGDQSTYTNEGVAVSTSSRLNYISSASKAGFDVGRMQLMVSDAKSGFPKTGNPYAPELGFDIMLSPNDTNTHDRWNSFVHEANIVNRGGEQGWYGTIGAPFGTGVYLAVTEASLLGYGGAAYDSLFHFVSAPSADADPSGNYKKTYNSFMCSPNADVGLQGNCFTASGDITGLPQSIPLTPLGVYARWMTGIDMRMAKTEDDAAMRIAVGQSIFADSGVNRPNKSAPTRPIATAALTSTGAGSNIGWNLTTAGTGVVKINGTQIPMGSEVDTFLVTSPFVVSRFANWIKAIIVTGGGPGGNGATAISGVAYSGGGGGGGGTCQIVEGPASDFSSGTITIGAPATHGNTGATVTFQGHIYKGGGAGADGSKTTAASGGGAEPAGAGGNASGATPGIGGGYLGAAGSATGSTSTGYSCFGSSGGASLPGIAGKNGGYSATGPTGGGGGAGEPAIAKLLVGGLSLGPAGFSGPNQAKNDGQAGETGLSAGQNVYGSGGGGGASSVTGTGGAGGQGAYGGGGGGGGSGPVAGGAGGLGGPARVIVVQSP